MKCVLFNYFRSEIKRSQRRTQSEAITECATEITEQAIQNIYQGQETSTPLKTGESLQLPSPSESPVIGDEDEDNTIATIDANTSFARSDATLLDSSTITNAINVSMFTDDDDDVSDGSLEDAASYISIHDLTKSALEDLNAEKQSYSEYTSISSSSDEDSDSSDLDLGHEPSDEHQDDEHREDYSQHSICTPAVSYGPHRKFSRGDDVYDLEEEFSM
ncbi:Hypothetical predicted protein, partial [Paramuricea clavata]